MNSFAKALPHFCCMFFLISCGKGSTEATTSERQRANPPNDLVDIVGIEIGGSQSFPECAKEYSSTVGTTYVGFPKNTPCWKFPLLLEKYRKSMSSQKSLTEFPDDLDDGEELEFDLGYGKTPEGVYSSARITLIGRKIEGISLSTRASDQVTINSLLTSKYGNPTASGVGQLQNEFGTQFQRIETQWKMPRMIVSFYGVTSDPDEGWVLASSPKLFKFLSDKKLEEQKQF